MVRISATTLLILLAVDAASGFAPTAFGPRMPTLEISSSQLNMAKKKKKKKPQKAPEAVAVLDPPTPAKEDDTAEEPIESVQAAEVTEAETEKKQTKAKAAAKPAASEADLAAKYAAIEDVGERAFAILSDLGIARN